MDNLSYTSKNYEHNITNETTRTTPHKKQLRTT